ncbi:glycoside hydrolase family 55 protein [Clostridium sp. MSJ-8]|uniref:glycosyl hydrolase family 28-related protein n=1 Tax=Clostridium sp. MSJ-8 TaxID=2841510 RepID=UPI001C0E997E|nr:glycosyl hydrolase family 28-related protein [Clostridium sp. MSJ-8]MBU5487109.1 glycoside hydrolase family 55 protein [Clostridium sp. MSJ-8]
MLYDIRNYGALGDGTNDDTIAINKCIEEVGSKGGGTILFSSGDYKVTDTIIISYSNITLSGDSSGKSRIIYYGKGYNMDLIRICGSYKNILHDITIEKLNIDGTNQLYKGGVAEDSLLLTAPNPLGKGMTGIRSEYAYNITIRDNTLTDIYGDGIICKRSPFTLIDHNTLWDCSASGMASTNTDYQGDGITAFMSFAVTISNNYVVNRRKFKVHNKLAKDVYDLQCGRSGLEFEYTVDMDNQKNPKRWCPFSSELVKNTTSGYALIAKNNYVYGYNKGMHLEYGVNVLIDGNTFVHNNIGILDATGGNTLITNNEFNSDNVGASPQGGYDWYYAAIAFTHFLGTDFDNPIVSNNRFYGDSAGIIIGRNKLRIENNEFRNTGHYIIQRIGVARDITIDGNRFVCNENLEKNKNYIDKFSIQFTDGKIINNTFNSKSVFMKLGMCMKECIFANNTFINTQLYYVYSNYNNIYNSNIFVDNISVDTRSFLANALNTDSIYECNQFFSRNGSMIIGVGDRSIFINNKIYMKNFNNFYLLDAGRDVLIANNEFKITEELASKKYLIRRFIASNTYNVRYANYIRINNNTIIGGGKDFFILFQQGDQATRSIEINNNIPNRYINITTNRPYNGQYYNIGDKTCENSDGSYYKCIKEGYYSDVKWKSGYIYSLGDYIINSDNKIYRCNSSGVASTIEPKHNKSNILEEDGVTWTYYGEIAEFVQIN